MPFTHESGEAQHKLARERQLPTQRVVVVEPPLELLLVEFRAPDPVVLALTVAGPIVLVWPLTTMKLADGPSENVVYIG